VYSKVNLNAKADDHPLLLTESPLNPKSNRDLMAQLFFETFAAPALFFAPPAVLSLYASGRTTGVVLDVGEGLTHCIPVYEGYALPHSISRSDIAGRDVTRHLQLLLRKSSLAFTTTAESDFVKKMKEDLCFVAPKSGTTTAAMTTDTTKDPVESATSVQDSSTNTPYQLPDGHVVHISSERFQAPEILFNPMLIGSEESGVADALLYSIQKSDLDLRATLYSQIVLAGGSTCIPGFGERLLAELRARAPAHTRLRISAPPERTYSAWTGGSILASLATFKNMWVTKSEWEEYGSNILYRGGI
jgi:centractin